MHPLTLSDRRRVEAAKGWCGLHVFGEANAELDQVTAEARAHPDVLEVRWQICANLDRWEDALDLANAIARALPNEPKGYIYTASSLRELGRGNEALLFLLQAVERFPQDEIILYDLACVYCLLGQVGDARAWLAKAVDVGGDAVKKEALDDQDLEPVSIEQR